MDLLLLLLAPSVILAHGYEKSNDPNDEPFLPIFPIYPYSPKLIKRGIETGQQLSTELYTPKVDAKDSYSASYSHHRDPYYPNYTAYSKVASPSSYSYYGSLPYSYPTAASYNGYGAYSAPYTVPSPSSYSPIPYSAAYPNYYYQPPYYYPGYYNKPPYPPPPPPPPPGSDYHGDSYSDSENGKGKEKNGDNKYREDNQFVDGGNYISGNPRDLDVQPSTYKTSSPRNQLEENVKDIQIPLPKTTYRVISVAGQPVGPDYPLPAPYQKAQQLEELMSHAWAKLLVQNLQQVAQNAGGKPSDGQSDQGKDARFVAVGNAAGKQGLTFIVNPNLVGKLNGQATTTQLKKFPVPLNPGVYTVKPEKEESNEYETYESQPPQGTQDYDGQDKQQQQQSYENEQNYQNQNYVTVQTPRAYSYQYTNYNSPINQQQPQQYKNNLDDVNFSTDAKKG